MPELQPWTGLQTFTRFFIRERLDVGGFPASIQPFFA
jgi:hypothetical protein